MSRRFWVILSVLLAFVGLIVYSYSALQIRFNGVQSIRPEFKVDAETLVQGGLALFVGDPFGAAAAAFEGVEVSGELVFSNESFVPIYVPATEHRVYLAGQELAKSAETNGFWLMPRSDRKELFKVLLTTEQIPEAAFSILVTGGNTDIELKSPLELGPITVTKDVTGSGEVTKSMQGRIEDRR